MHRGADRRGRGWACVGALSVLVTAGLVGMGTGLHGSALPPTPGPDQRGTVRIASSAPGGPVLGRSRPVRLDVPSVGVHTRLMRLGLNTDGTLEVPSRPLLAGWYTGSPAPGERGPSIIAGHVDSEETGPAVFYHLGEVEPGDRVNVTLQGGEVASFEVIAVRSYSAKDFPTRMVYGNTDRAVLRLITCANWNDEKEAYDGNLVVFAVLDQPGA